MFICLFVVIIIYFLPIIVTGLIGYFIYWEMIYVFDLMRVVSFGLELVIIVRGFYYYPVI